MEYTFGEQTPRLHSSAYIAPGAMIIGNVDIEEEASVWFNAVLRGDNENIKIGAGTNIQDGTILHVDPGYPVNIAGNVTVGHNVILHGCTIEEGALIGMGATVLNGAVIEKGALVAAGSLVREGTRVEAGMLVAGVPAKPLRRLSDKNQEAVQRGSKSYINKSRQFMKENIK